MKKVTLFLLALAMAFSTQVAAAYAVSPTTQFADASSQATVISSERRQTVERRISANCVTQLMNVDPQVTQHEKEAQCGSIVTTTLTLPSDVQLMRADPNHVKYGHYSQEEVAMNRAWKVHHDGLWYWDGKVAWIDSQFGWDAHGSHNCRVDYAFGYSISQVECKHWGSGNVGMWTQYKIGVSFLFKGFPMYNEIDMKINLGNNGSMVFYKDR